MYTSSTEALNNITSITKKKTHAHGLGRRYCVLSELSQGDFAYKKSLFRI